MTSSKNVNNLGQSQTQVESRAIWYAGASAGVALILAFLYFMGNGTIPIFGRVSIGTTSIFLASIAAFIVYYSVLYQNRKPEKQQKFARKVYLILGMAALSFIHAALVFLLLTLGFYIFSQAFTGATIDKYMSSVMVAVIVGAVSYAIYLIAMAKTTLLVSTTLAAFLVTGVLTSMITASNPYWWQMHLSSLGGTDSFSSYAFNLTLIIGGIVVMCIADLIADDLSKLRDNTKKFANARVGAIRWLLVVMGAFLAGVGLFPYNVHLVLHNISASGMVLLFLILIIGMRFFLTSFSKTYFTLSYILLGAIVVSIYLFAGIGYFDLTAFEMISFGIVFTWLVVFIRQIAAESHDLGIE